MEQFTVQLNNATCTVCIGAGVLGRAGALLRQHVPQVRRWALAADEAVSAFYGEWVQGSLRAAGLESRLFLLPQGESAKTPEAWLSLCRRILDSGFDRSCGVVTLGGKTALDLPEGKNLLGAFHQPSLVLSDPACLATLPQRQFASGMAEVIKTGLVADSALLAAAEQGLRSDSGEALTALIAACGRAKLHLVSGDAEDHGARRLLNFGHTFGHGYEAVGGYDTWTHGEAVAAGMCRTLRWQIANGYGGTDVLARLEPLLTRYGLPTAIDCDEAALRRCVGHDKKTAGGTVQLVIVRCMGQGELVTVPLSDLWEDKA